MNKYLIDAIVIESDSGGLEYTTKKRFFTEANRPAEAKENVHRTANVSSLVHMFVHRPTGTYEQMF